MKIVFMGTPEFAVPSLKTLVSEGHEVVLTVTQPDRKGNRGKMTPPPVKIAAEELGIEVIQPQQVKGNTDLIKKLEAISPDVIAVAAYGRILPTDILEIPTFGCINVHASLLPKYRGASPIHSAILNGDEEAGVTIMQMAEGLDTGDMLSSVSIPIEGMNYTELSEKLADAGGKLLCKVLTEISKGSITPVKQDESKATFTGIIKKEDGRINFDTMSSKQIERMLNAYHVWPGVYCTYKDDILKVKGAMACEEDREGKPGEIISVSDSGICVKCAEGILLITELQLPGKKTMPVSDFLRGNHVESGMLLK